MSSPRLLLERCLLPVRNNGSGWLHPQEGRRRWHRRSLQGTNKAQLSTFKKESGIMEDKDSLFSVGSLIRKVNLLVQLLLQRSVKVNPTYLGIRPPENWSKFKVTIESHNFAVQRLETVERLKNCHLDTYFSPNRSGCWRFSRWQTLSMQSLKMLSLKYLRRK